MVIVITNKSENNDIDGVPLRALLRTRALL